MAKSSKKLGKLISIHGVSPVYMQRAAIVAVLAFVFFLAMLIAFSIRQQVGYFVLASAFLVVEIFTLLGIFAHRRTLLQIFESGFSYKKQKRGWDEVREINKNDGYEIVCSDGAKLTLPSSIHDLDRIVEYIRSRAFPPE